MPHQLVHPLVLVQLLQSFSVLQFATGRAAVAPTGLGGERQVELEAVNLPSQQFTLISSFSARECQIQVRGGPLVPEATLFCAMA